MTRGNRTSNIAFVTLLLLTTAGSAHAYLDPGTGSFAIQVLVASAVGALFAVKRFWGAITTAIVVFVTVKLLRKPMPNTESATVDA